MAWTEQLPSGRWQGKYRDASGEKRSAGTYPHELKALAKAMEAEEASRLPGWRDPRSVGRKWGDWSEVWWAARKTEASTARSDASIRSKHLTYWDDVPLVEINRFAIKEWISVLYEKELAPSSVARIVRVFSTSLSAAVDAEILLANPAFRLGISPPDEDTIRFFTRKEVVKFRKRLKEQPRDRAVVSLLVGCGPRWGEMAALHERYVDLKSGSVRVQRTMDQATKKIKPYTKGRRARSVPLPDWVAEEIKPFVKAARKSDSGLLFPGLDASNWRQGVWVPLETGGRIHDLRHTYASWLLQAGVPLAEVSVLMGHSSQRVTERYAHLAEIPSDSVKAAMEL